MEEKTEKRPWQAAKERSLKAVIAKLESMGYTMTDEAASKTTVTKNLTKFRTFLLNDYEFKGTNIFVIFNEDYSNYIDLDGKVCTEPQLYIIPKIDNYADVYENLNLHPYGPYAVPVADFKTLPYKEGFEPKKTKSVKASKVGTGTGLLDLETPGPDVENWDENLSTMTIKDFIAILHCYPVSDKSEINEIIKRINVSRTKG